MAASIATKMASLGLSHLGKSGVLDISVPVIDRLSQACAELVRLASCSGPTARSIGWAATALGTTCSSPRHQSSAVAASCAASL
jgi:DNA-binding IclR family transcriptional regulator